MSPIADHIASCSFCTKPSTAVRRLVAGPGVSICDECVARSATIIADVDAGNTTAKSATRRSPDDYSADDILGLLPTLAATAGRVEADLAAWVNRLRARGVAWSTIADTLGVDAAAARRRFESDV